MAHAAGVDQTPDIVVLGNATIDDLVFCDGTTRMGQAGGNAIYTACGALLWHQRVGLCAVAGHDYPIDHIAAERLDLRGVRWVDGPSLRNWALYEEDGTCQYIFRRGPQAHERYSPQPADIPAPYLSTRYTHVAPVPFPYTVALLAALSETRQRGGLSIDPDVRYCALLPADSRNVLMAGLTFFLPSQREAALLYPGLSVRDILERVRVDYPHVQVAAVKVAADGCMLYDRQHDEIYHLPAVPANVVDTTGAGDAFCGGFLAGHALTGDGVEAAIHGLVSASFIVESYGVPRAEDLRREAAERRLADYRDLLARHPAVMREAAVPI